MEYWLQNKDGRRHSRTRISWDALKLKLMNDPNNRDTEFNAEAHEGNTKHTLCFTITGWEEGTGELPEDQITSKTLYRLVLQAFTGETTLGTYFTLSEALNALRSDISFKRLKELRSDEDCTLVAYREDYGYVQATKSYALRDKMIVGEIIIPAGYQEELF